MRKFDSSLTRVGPIFDKLLERDSTGGTWLNNLLKLADPGQSPLPSISPLQRWGWGTSERGLHPPASLLKWLVQNPRTLKLDALKRSSPKVRQLRELLLSGDKETQQAAVDKLRRPHRSRGWFIFEGTTYPDVYLETETAIIVIEGKRTEADITRDTTWMPVRHQVLRHIDSAWDIRGQRKVVGMFIVEGIGGAEGEEVPQHWRTVCSETTKAETVAGSLPHRSINERDQIAASYIGVTTWQRLCAEFHIPWEELPDQTPNMKDSKR